MKVKFNKFERVAGLFVLTAVIGSLLVMGLVAVKQSWFETRLSFYTEVDKAEGLFPGTKVKMAGLQVGRVEKIILKESTVKVEFSVLQSFAVRIKEDSEIVMSRPFLLGEKVLDISTGSVELPVLPPGSSIATSFSFDLMDLMNPRVIAPHLETLGRLADNLKFVAEAFLDKDRSQAFIEMFDELKPLLKNVNIAAIEVKTLSDQMTTNKNLKTLMHNMAYTTTELNKELGNMLKVGKDLPAMATNTAEVMKNLSVLTKHMNDFIPAMQKISPHLPKAGMRALEAMDEAVVVLKAMQKSFVLRAAVEEVREEEKNKNRKPSSFKDGD